MAYIALGSLLVVVYSAIVLLAFSTFVCWFTGGWGLCL